jgi:hypothetical protein
MFENRVLRRLFGPKGEEVTGPKFRCNDNIKIGLREIG